MPFERVTAAIVADLGKAIDTDGHDTTFAQLLVILGRRSHLLVILVFSLLNMLPGPPGYGGTVACCIIAFAIALVRGADIKLPPIIGERRVPKRLLRLLHRRLPAFARLVSRFTRPRLQLLAGPRTTRPIGLIVLILALPMVLPIPLINAIPNVGLAVICASRLNRDGFGVIAGVIIGVIGLGVAAGFIWAAIALGIAALAMLGR